MSSDVLVVGAGPVGLTVAIELRRRGVECRIIDRLPQAAPYAKAVGIQPRTLELWEQQGLLRDVLDAATPLRGQLVYVNGTQVSRLDLAVPPDVPFGFVALPQNVTEGLLAERLRQVGGQVERGVELVGFDQDVDGVTVRLTGAAGEQTTQGGLSRGCRRRAQRGPEGPRARVHGRRVPRGVHARRRRGGLVPPGRVRHPVDAPDGWPHRRRAGVHPAARRRALPDVDAGARRAGHPGDRRGAARDRGRPDAEPAPHPGGARSALPAADPGARSALVLGVPHQPSTGRPLQRGARVRRGGRGAHPPADRGTGHEHGHPGRGQPGVEARAGRAGRRGGRLARQLPRRAPPGRRGSRRAHGAPRPAGHRGRQGRPLDRHPA